MAVENGSIIQLPAEIINKRESSPPDTPSLSMFWTVNTVINSLFSSNNAHSNELLTNDYFKGSVFEEIRLQLNVIVNNLYLIEVNEKEGGGGVRFQIWKELGGSVSEFVTELLEKWDTKLCELQYHHLNNCEVAFDDLVSEFCQTGARTLQRVHNQVWDSFSRQGDDMWGNERLFWEIDSAYPFREFQFGQASEEGISSTPVTLVYLSGILHPYVSIWSNIQSLFSALLRRVFLVDSASMVSVDIRRVELNMFVLEALFGSVERSILIVDEYMLDIWVSLLKKCIDSFVRFIPSAQSSLREFPSDKRSSGAAFHDSICILQDILSSCSNGRTCFLDSIGDIFGIRSENEISVLESVLRTVRFEDNLIPAVPAQLLDADHLQSRSRAFPVHMLFTSGRGWSFRGIEPRYAFQSNIGGLIRDLNRSLKAYYKEQFIKEGEGGGELGSGKALIARLVGSQAGFEGYQGIRIVDFLSCLRDLVTLEESCTEQLVRTLRLDSRRKFPNINVDPTEANLSMKLQSGRKGVREEEREHRRKIMSMFLLEFEVGDSRHCIKGQLPTYYSLRIRLNSVSMGSSPAGSQLLACGIPGYLVLQFFSKDVMDEYSYIFGFLLEVKRCSMFLNQVFQSLAEVSRERQAILLCKQREEGGVAQEDFDSAQFCNDNCLAVMRWVDSLLGISQKMRFSIQFVVDAYSCCFSMHSPLIWEEFRSSLGSDRPISSMVESHRRYLGQLHQLALAPNKRSKDGAAVDQSFQSVSVSFVLLLKLARRLSVLTLKVVRLVRFLKGVDSVIRSRRHVPCMMLRRRVQQTVKRTALAFEVLHSEFTQGREQFLGSLRGYVLQSGSDRELEFLLSQLEGGGGGA